MLEPCSIKKFIFKRKQNNGANKKNDGVVRSRSEEGRLHSCYHSNPHKEHSTALKRSLAPQERIRLPNPIANPIAPLIKGRVRTRLLIQELGNNSPP